MAAGQRGVRSLACAHQLGDGVRPGWRPAEAAGALGDAPQHDSAQQHAQAAVHVLLARTRRLMRHRVLHI